MTKRDQSWSFTRTQLPVLYAIVASFLLVACGRTSTAPTPSSSATAVPTMQPGQMPSPLLTPVAVVKVSILDKGGTYAFDPTTVTIKVGTEVIWMNTTNVPHTVTSDTGVFNTANNLAEKQTFMVIFTKSGTYPYYCNFHLNMKGMIIVKP